MRPPILESASIFASEGTDEGLTFAKLRRLDLRKPKCQMSNVQSNPNVKIQNKCRISFDIWAWTLIWHLDFDI